MPRDYWPAIARQLPLLGPRGRSGPDNKYRHYLAVVGAAVVLVAAAGGVVLVAAGVG